MCPIPIQTQATPEAAKPPPGNLMTKKSSGSARWRWVRPRSYQDQSGRPQVMAGRGLRGRLAVPNFARLGGSRVAGDFRLGGDQRSAGRSSPAMQPENPRHETKSQRQATTNGVYATGCHFFCAEITIKPTHRPDNVSVAVFLRRAVGRVASNSPASSSALSALMFVGYRFLVASPDFFFQSTFHPVHGKPAELWFFFRFFLFWFFFFLFAGRLPVILRQKTSALTWHSERAAVVSIFDPHNVPKKTSTNRINFNNCLASK